MASYLKISKPITTLPALQPRQFRIELLELFFYILYFYKKKSQSLKRNTTRKPTNCPSNDDYSPCTCFGGDSIFPSITCNQVPISAVVIAFAQAIAVNVPLRFTLTPSPTDIFLPDNIMGTNKFAETISIRCPTATYKLQVSPNAFRSSMMYTTSFFINACDLSAIDMSFLTSFNNLTYLSFITSTNVQYALETLSYSLPSLCSLNFYNTKGLNQTVKLPPVLANGLNDIDMGFSGLDDEAANRILDWVVKSSNATLTTIYLDKNHLTKIPSQIPEIKMLNFLDISSNQIVSVLSGALSFTAPVTRISLKDNNISTIQPYSFQGINTIFQIFYHNLKSKYYGTQKILMLCQHNDNDSF